MNRLLGLAGLATLVLALGSCGPKRTRPLPRPAGFALPVLGALEISTESRETRHTPSGTTTTVKSFTYRHAVSALPDGGLHIQTPTVRVFEYTLDGQAADERSVQALTRLLPLTRPGFRVNADGQFDGLVDFQPSGLPMLDEQTLRDTMEDRWRWVAGGWEPNPRVGKARREEIEVGMPGSEAIRVRLAVTRTRLADMGCIEEPDSACRERRLESVALSGPVRGSLVATIVDYPRSHWPQVIQIERESRDGATGKLLKSEERSEVWTFEKWH